jgi:hypothetical protein
MAVLCFFLVADDRLEDKVQLPDHGIRAVPYQQTLARTAWLKLSIGTEISRNTGAFACKR